jgi:hypothetical protein
MCMQQKEFSQGDTAVGDRIQNTFRKQVQLERDCDKIDDLDRSHFSKNRHHRCLLTLIESAVCLFKRPFICNVDGFSRAKAMISCRL